ncbi:MAG: tRNA lysidine(34) synthetase TilS [Pirellulales bacterium]
MITTTFNDHALESRFNAAWPAHSWCDSHVVLAVSAGPDSVAMLRAAVALKQAAGGSGRLYVAHLNHALRGTEADIDETWLTALCTRLSLPLEVGKADVAEIAAQLGDGLESAARVARYDFLARTAERVGARFVATAHTADDDVETILHHIIRGTGLAGLAGIPGVRPLSNSVSLVRPLLGARRRELLEYLAALKQDYRIDTSNADPQWTRNQLRHQLLPTLREHYNANVDAALLRLATQASESQQLITDLAGELARQCVAMGYCKPPLADGSPVVRRVQIDCRPLVDQPSLVIREVCKNAWNEARWPQQAMGYDQWQQLAELVHGDGDLPAINLPGNIRACREGHLLVLDPLDLA